MNTCKLCEQHSKTPCVNFFMRENHMKIYHKEIYEDFINRFFDHQKDEVMIVVENSKEIQELIEELVKEYK